MSNSQRQSISTKRRRFLNELSEIRAINSIESDSLQPLQETHRIDQNIPVVQSISIESDDLHEGAY